MATPYKSTSLVSLNPFLQCLLKQKLSNSSNGRVAIFWDIENCPVPSDVRPDDVAGNILKALMEHPETKGAAVVKFSAYGDFTGFSTQVTEGCQGTGVQLIYVPRGRKNAVDWAIMSDMSLFVLDNCPPSFIMLISRDADFTLFLHTLGRRGYNVINVVPVGVGVSSAVINAGKFVWDWPSMARGCLVPLSKEEAIVYSGISRNDHNSWGSSIVSQSLSECNSSTDEEWEKISSDMVNDIDN